MALGYKTSCLRSKASRMQLQGLRPNTKKQQHFRHSLCFATDVLLERKTSACPVAIKCVIGCERIEVAFPDD